MRLSWAIAAGLALGAGIAWWSAQQAPSAGRGAAASTASQHAEATPLYRWRNADGVLQITDTPPRDRPFEPVAIPLDRNVVPLTPPARAADGDAR